MWDTYSPKNFSKLVGVSVFTLQRWDRYCLEHGIKVDQWVEDVGCALHYKRKGLNQVIEDIALGRVKRLIIGSEDRFVRFGYDWFEAFCERHGSARSSSTRSGGSDFPGHGRSPKHRL